VVKEEKRKKKVSGKVVAKDWRGEVKRRGYARQKRGVKERWTSEAKEGRGGQKRKERRSEEVGTEAGGG